MNTQTIRQSRPRAGGETLASFEAIARDLAAPWSKAFESWRSGVEDMLARTARPTASRKGCSCGCGCECRDTGCVREDCHCSCCVADSDLVIEARLGELRVVPIVIENRWRRERPIEVQLSDWSCGAGKLAIEGHILEPAKFTIEPCGEHTLTLLLRVGGQGKANDSPRVPEDLDGCKVCYADLRIKGCDARSIRIAVAVLPNDCGAYRVDCCQACC